MSIYFITDLLTIKSRNPSNKTWTVETVKNSKFRRADVLNKGIVTRKAVKLKRNAETTNDNRNHAISTYNDHKKRIELSWNETKVCEQKSRQI